jgi:carboxypeptidase family protein
MKFHAQRFHICLAAILAGMLTVSIPVLCQDVDRPELKLGSIVGTVTDVNGDTIPDATVVLEGADANDRRSVVANDNGYFEFHDVKPGIPYQVKISAEGFSEWSSPPVILEPSQSRIVADIRLQVQLAQTTVYVTQTSEEVATEQVKVEEKQRVLGIIPNFYVVYDPDPVPLTTKLKFRLALRVATDPITALGVAFLSGTQQAGDTPNYGQGAEGFGKRFGANAADGFTDIMIGGAILPSILHQDPRYFYQGTGTKKSRIQHAVFHPFVCKGDKGNWQPNYSTLGGDLASSAISNAYYPQSNRGAGLVFTNFAISTAERVATSLAQEFVLRPLQSHGR